MDTNDQTARARHWANNAWKLPVIAGCLLFAIELFRFPLVNRLTVFIEPIIELTAALILAGTILGILVRAFGFRRCGGRVWIPVAVCVLVALIDWLFPFNAVYLRVDFHLKQAARTHAARQILSGREAKAINDGGRGNLVHLPGSQTGLSDDGEILVDHRGSHVFVLFFTFRGILDRFSGYVYSPDDTPPANDQFGGDGVEIERVAPHWYWYAS